MTRLVALLLLCWLTFPALAQVTLVLSDDGGLYQQAATTMRRELARHGIGTVQQTRAERASLPGETWTVALGATALEKVLRERSNTPVFALLVPAETFRRLAATSTRPATALYLDQPLERIAALQRAALPTATRSIALLGSRLSGSSEALTRAAARQQLSMHTRTVRDGVAVFRALDELAGPDAVFWLLPDPQVANRSNLQALLLQTYRRRSPVLAYSAGLVEAGAALGLFATPEQLGHEAGGWLAELVTAGERPTAARARSNPVVPPARYPSSFTVAINPGVARSLDLVLPSVPALTQRLRAQEPP